MRKFTTRITLNLSQELALKLEEACGDAQLKRQQFLRALITTSLRKLKV